jgi:hypothetical protein
MTETTPDNRAEAFSRVLSGLLRPLVRALIAQGVTAPAFYRLLKRLYVDVAEKEFRLDASPPTDSRISLLTGVHRRDVSQMRGGKNDMAATQEKVTTLATVLGRWLADPQMLADDGAPRPLPRVGADGPSFESLVQSVSRDIRPRTILDELVRQGLVDLDETSGEVTLRASAFFGPADLDQKVHFFAENVGDHIAAAVDNLLSDQPKFLERAVFYNRLKADSVDELEVQAREIGVAALVELNRLANERQAVDIDDPEGTERFRFGVFFYRENEADDRHDQDGGKRGERTDDDA